MNDMKETVAEIRRRGAGRIRARKRLRNRITALCVPVVLFVAAVLTMPEFGQPTNVSRPVETRIPAETKPNNTIQSQDFTQALQASSAVIMKVSGEGLAVEYSDPETVMAMMELLQKSVFLGQSPTNAADDTREVSDLQGRQDASRIRLLFTAAGETREFILDSGRIIDVLEKTEYKISFTQTQAIEKILGLELP